MFNTVAQDYDKLVDSYSIQRRAEAMLSYLTPGKTLEVGAGSGAVATRLGTKKNLTVSDISVEMCRIASKKLGVRCVVADAQDLPFKDESFANVISSEMIYYLDRPEDFFREAFRVLRPGGRLIMSSAQPIARLYDLARTIARKLHLAQLYFDDPIRSFPSAGKLKSWLSGAGFQVIGLEMIVVFPLRRLHSLNKAMEKTPLRRLSLFCIAVGQKS